MRADYRVFYEVPSRWLDNDIYGHINNVNYYSFFDTAIAHYLIREGGLEPWQSEVIGYCVESGCRFRQGARFPDRITAGLKVSEARPLERHLRDRHLSQRRRPGGGRWPFRARLRRPGERTAGADPGPDPGGARRACSMRRIEPSCHRDQLAGDFSSRQDCAFCQSVARAGADRGETLNGQRARLRINLSQREFEVEGSEAFVKAYVERFEAWLAAFDQPAEPGPAEFAAERRHRAGTTSARRPELRRAVAPSAAGRERRRPDPARRLFRLRAERRQVLQHRRSQHAPDRAGGQGRQSLPMRAPEPARQARVQASAALPGIADRRRLPAPAARAPSCAA